MYDSATGIFLSVDPTGFKSGDTNLSRYAANNPINRMDPNGTESEHWAERVENGPNGVVWHHFAEKEMKPGANESVAAQAFLYWAAHDGRELGRVSIWVPLDGFASVPHDAFLLGHPWAEVDNFEKVKEVDRKKLFEGNDAQRNAQLQVTYFYLEKTGGEEKSITFPEAPNPNAPNPGAPDKEKPALVTVTHIKGKGVFYWNFCSKDKTDWGYASMPFDTVENNKVKYDSKDFQGMGPPPLGTVGHLPAEDDPNYLPLRQQYDKAFAAFMQAHKDYVASGRPPFAWAARDDEYDVLFLP